MTRPLFPLETDPLDAGSSSGSSVLYCPVCRIVVHQIGREDWRPLAEIADEAETACRAHLTDVHPVRLWIYDTFGWAWPLRGEIS